MNSRKWSIVRTNQPSVARQKAAVRGSNAFFPYSTKLCVPREIEVSELMSVAIRQRDFFLYGRVPAASMNIAAASASAAERTNSPCISFSPVIPTKDKGGDRDQNRNNYHGYIEESIYFAY